MHRLALITLFLLTHDAHGGAVVPRALSVADAHKGHRRLVDVDEGCSVSYPCLASDKCYRYRCTNPIDATTSYCSSIPCTPCLNTCGSSMDGVCDDGGENSDNAICFYGRDCLDCGPRSFDDAWASGLPVAPKRETYEGLCSVFDRQLDGNVCSCATENGDSEMIVSCTQEVPYLDEIGFKVHFKPCQTSPVVEYSYKFGGEWDSYIQLEADGDPLLVAIPGASLNIITVEPGLYLQISLKGTALRMSIHVELSLCLEEDLEQCDDKATLETWVGDIEIGQAITELGFPYELIELDNISVAQYCPVSAGPIAGGVIAAIVVVGLLVFVVMRRKKQKKKETTATQAAGIVLTTPAAPESAATTSSVSGDKI